MEELTNMNKVILMGRLTKDPDVRYSQGEKETAVDRYNLAVDRRFKSENSDQTDDFIQTGIYTNKDGQKIYTTDVVAEDQEFAESKASQGGAASSSEASTTSYGGFTDIPEGIDEELPFN